MKRIVVLFLAVIMCMPMFTGCSKPPELANIKSELIAVLEASYDVNEILFGDGLKTEYDLSGITEEYTDEMKNFETYYSEEQMYYQFYSPVVSSYMKDTDGDGVSDTEIKQPTTVDEIRAMAAKVYSESFMNGTFIQIFKGGEIAINGTLQTLKKRYSDGFLAEGEESDESVMALRKYKYINENNMNYISGRGGRTVYDYDTMKIIKPSDADTVVIQIMGLYQDYTLDTSSSNYNDWDSDPSGYSWHAVKLVFVKENGAWKLDGASY